MLELNKMNGKAGHRKMSWVKLQEIIMRDPFILTDRKQNCYFLYGTDMMTCDGAANVDPCFLCYVSEDLENFYGPYIVFEPEKGFWGVKNYWAPEVYEYEGKYYMLASFKGGIKEDRGTAVLVADAPEGPFREHSHGHVTLPGHECLDGTLYIEEGQPWVIFCHEWTEIYYGKIKALPLEKDLSKVEDYKKELLLVDTQTDGIPWIRQMRDDRVGKTGYLTDAPFLYKMKNGRLLLLWSSYAVNENGGKGGYVVAGCVSKSGRLEGPWEHLEHPLLDVNAGHGALFLDLHKQLRLVLHTNDTAHGEEHPMILSVKENEEGLLIENMTRRICNV